VRRNKTVFAAAAAVMAALVVGLGFSLYLFVQEREALQKERDALVRAVAAERQEKLLREQAEKGLALERKMREIASVAPKLSTAGMLMSQGLFDKAEELMSDVPPLIPSSSGIYNVLGNLRGHQGQWQRAITNFVKSIEVDPTNHIGFQYLAPLYVQTGDLKVYYQLRERILREFGTNSDPTVAERMAKVSMILPPPADALETLAKMASVSVGAGPTAEYWAYYEMVKGLAEYRQAYFADAVEWLQKVVSKGGDPARTVQAYAVLAMAQYQQGQRSEARATLAAGNALADKDLETDKVLNWHDRITALALLREAGALVQSDSKESGVSQ
jgi:tetratricopeptide (TPR) repeat protein